MAYPQPKDEFLGGLAEAVEAGVGADWRERLDLEIGLDIGIADARLRRSRQNVETDLRRPLRRLVPGKGDHRTAIMLIDDIDLVSDQGDALLQLRRYSDGSSSVAQHVATRTATSGGSPLVRWSGAA